MGAEEIITAIAEKLSGATRVNAVFGEPQVIGSKTIIPIAATGLGFGAGAGKCKPESEDGAKGEGGGGGGGGGVKPLAVLEVTEQETRIIPVIDMTKVILTSILVGGLTVGGIIKLIGKCRNHE